MSVTGFAIFCLVGFVLPVPLLLVVAVVALLHLSNSPWLSPTK